MTAPGLVAVGGAVLALLVPMGLIGTGAVAAPPVPVNAAPTTLQERQEQRFPQPVRVGRLVGEYVVERGVTLRRLGPIVGVFRENEGELEIVFRYGASFGLGGRLIAPPLQELSLVGPMVKVNELDSKDLAALPTFTGADGAYLKPKDTILMGVDRKY